MNSPSTELRLPDTAGLGVADAAVAWVEAGWTVIPVRPTNKVPYMTWDRVEGLSPVAARNLFEGYPKALCGVILPVEIVVLDIDHRPERGWQADQIREELQRRYQLPDGPSAQTPSGGQHLWFTLPAGVAVSNSASRTSKFPVAGVDVRSRRGLVMVPPSRRQSGAYQWLRWAPEAPMAPAALCQDLCPPTEETEAPPKPQPRLSRPGQLSAYIEKAYASEIAAVRTTGSGGRNDQLFRSAAALGSLIAAGALPRDHVFQSLMMAASECGLVKDDGARSVAATIESGLKAGLRTPRQLPEYP